MPVNSRALKQLVDWDARAKRLAAVVAASAKRGCRLLRTIVNGVRISGARRCRGGGIELIWTGAYCLVIDAGRNAASLARRIVGAIVIGIKGNAVLPG